MLFQDRFVVTAELQQYVAGNTQRVAKLICHKADFEVWLRPILSEKFHEYEVPPSMLAVWFWRLGHMHIKDCE